MLLAACGAPADNAAEAQRMPERTEIGELAMPPADLDSGEDEAAPTVSATIPAAFHGRWAASAALCGGDDESRLTVSAGGFSFFESVGDAVTVTPVAPRTVDVAGSFSGEGMSWLETHRLALSPDEQSLAVTTRGTAVQRVRCP